ncbi:MAG: tRNA (adenosine(37)-N6)-threonylcarbamoyltransferase complex transferase subunit TsaD [Candidatus Omnitrophota bacterium]|nr:MAG: tRNA (adenosine(37)-N6)-threonylcarbamoyltransferase complex transferase subunit TsaD [Candidatus Omnitrophota bacterium]
MYVLGIETSCDETSCAILRNYRVVSNITISSLREHKKYGGVIPEIATRAHLKNIDRVLNVALREARLPLKRVGLVSVTYKPGLIGALVVGLNFAKALSLSLNKPFIGVNHLHAHLFAPFLNNKEKLQFPFLGVVVSGGHTEIYLVNDFDRIKLLGQTRDDACGEVYDKIARALELGYPGGPVIDRLYNADYRNKFCFKCGRVGFDLSFSGIKTAVIYKRMELQKKRILDKETKVKLVSSFQHSVVQTMVKTIIDAAQKHKIKRIVCGGGVIANKLLRQTLKQAQARTNCECFLSPLAYCGDNAAIVAGLGFYLYNKRGVRRSINLAGEAN